VPSIREPEDYERCLLEILHAAGGRASRGHVFREFERRYASSIPREEEGRWQRKLEEAARRRAMAPDPDRWELG
jgi:hypothetical protein